MTMLRAAIRHFSFIKTLKICVEKKKDLECGKRRGGGKTGLGLNR
jgi:hypothetical protein